MHRPVNLNFIPGAHSIMLSSDVHTPCHTNRPPHTCAHMYNSKNVNWKIPSVHVLPPPTPILGIYPMIPGLLSRNVLGRMFTVNVCGSEKVRENLLLTTSLYHTPTQRNQFQCSDTKVVEIVRSGNLSL